MSASSAAGAAAKSGGGVPLLATVGAYCMSLLSATFYPLVLLFGVFSGTWCCVTNSPTLRSRRFMCQVVLFHGMIYFTWQFLMLSRTMIFHISYPNVTENQTFYLASFFVCAFPLLMPIYCVVSAIIVNRIWRHIVLEDMRGNLSVTAKPTPQSVKRLLT